MRYNAAVRSTVTHGGSQMDVLVNTDSSVENNATLSEQVETNLRTALDRFASKLTRVEVHLSDENSHKHGADDKRCVIEARIAGRQPTAVTHNAPDIDKAVAGAVDKLKRSLDSVFGKLATH